MDLQIERNIEAFIKIAATGGTSETSPLSWQVGPCQFSLEVLPVRLVLSGVVSVVRDNVIERVLQQCIPQNTHGVIQRAFIANNQLYLSCNLPLTEDAFFWVQIALWQQKILTMCAGRK